MLSEATLRYCDTPLNRNLRRFGIAGCWRLSARLVCGYVYALLVSLKKDRANQNEDRNNSSQHKAYGYGVARFSACRISGMANPRVPSVKQTRELVVPRQKPEGNTLGASHKLQGRQP